MSLANQPQLRMWVPWSELVQQQRTALAEFKALLSKHPKAGFLIACAKLSVGFDYGPDARTVPSDKTLVMLIPHLFPPGLVKGVNWFANQKRIIFFQGQLRYLAAEVIRLQPSPPEDLPGPENHELGEFMLRAGELLYKPHVVVQDKLGAMANLAAEFLPIYELDSPTDPMFVFLRFYILLTIIIDRLPSHLRLFDAEKEFQKLFPFPLVTYAEFIAAFALHATQERNNSKNYDAPIDATLRKSWFKNTNISQDLIDKMFDSVSFSLDNLPEPKDTLGYGDFEFIRDRPYFLHNGDLYLLDYEFALGKLESAVVWRVLRKLPENKKEPFLSFWGHIFEEYVVWMFETYADPTLNVLHSGPLYVGSADQICDSIIVSGDRAVLIEAKLATCKASVRYSGDYLQVTEYLEDRLVTGAGVCQLLSAVKTISASPEKLPDWLKGIKKIIPVIITKDDVGSSWAVNAYLNRRFKDQLSPKSHKGLIVTPLVSLSISSLERSMWALKEKSLADVLEERIHTNPDMAWPFDAACKYAHKGAARKLHKHFDAYQDLTEKLIKDFDMHEEDIGSGSVQR
jgi:hypothetical protein